MHGQFEKLRKYGISTNGIITNKSFKNQWTYSISYRFIVDNITITMQIPLIHKDVNWDSIQIGQQLEIIYDPLQPDTINRPRIAFNNDEQMKNYTFTKTATKCLLLITMVMYCLTSAYYSHTFINNGFGIEFIGSILFFLTICCLIGIAIVICFPNMFLLQKVKGAKSE